MAHHSTVFGQLLKWVPRHEFETLANRHHQGQKLRRWSQFVALGLAQLAGRNSLRDIVSNLSAQAAKLYHLGIRPITRSSLARVNERQPYELYEALFGKLLARCQRQAPRHGFRFRNKLYSLDASTIDLCLSVFPWAKFRRIKGAVKLHVGLDHDGLLPSFVALTEGKTHDVTIGRTLTLPAGSIVVVDRGYTDYAWFKALADKGIFFVIRQKKNARYRVTERRDVPAGKGLRCDQTIRITGTKAKVCPIPLRRIAYRDAESGQRYVFLSNNFHPRGGPHDRRYLQGPLAGRAVFQIHQAESQDQEFCRHLEERRDDAGLDRDVRLLAAGLDQVSKPDRAQHAADATAASAESLRSSRPASATERRSAGTAR